ncbi:hypothetical protein HYFRA_00008734 [Hymenoscyphus fraxineus]|uniref:Uncharacterized protein n=1 Tax=Hymenoscyphus fraxineus TaxID=746836 RepID=A0A9N9KYL8_9HELO|nr:hypothetical protein HYFRA_00008734 [Hymenoscyphus fraxineus]
MPELSFANDFSPETHRRILACRLPRSGNPRTWIFTTKLIFYCHQEDMALEPEKFRKFNSPLDPSDPSAGRSTYLQYWYNKTHAQEKLLAKCPPSSEDYDNINRFKDAKDSSYREPPFPVNLTDSAFDQGRAQTELLPIIENGAWMSSEIWKGTWTMDKGLGGTGDVSENMLGWIRSKLESYIEKHKAPGKEGIHDTDTTDEWESEEHPFMIPERFMKYIRPRSKGYTIKYISDDDKRGIFAH